MLEIREYINPKGRVPYRNWLTKLDAPARARIVTAVLRVEMGNLASVKSVGRGVSELRLDFGPGYRVYFGRDGERLVILLCGGSKRRQQADIDAAQAYWSDYKARKREE
jgi:putative addiction module killer protein